MYVCMYVCVFTLTRDVCTRCLVCRQMSKARGSAGLSGSNSRILVVFLSVRCNRVLVVFGGAWREKEGQGCDNLCVCVCVCVCVCGECDGVVWSLILSARILFVIIIVIVVCLYTFTHMYIHIFRYIHI